MIVSYIDQFVYVPTPKTGTRSVMRFLLDNFLSEKLDEHGNIIPKDAAKFYTFTTVRNPYDRAVSIWWATCRRENGSGKYDDLRNKGLGERFGLFMEYILNTMNKKGRPPKKLYPLALPQHTFLSVTARLDKVCRMETLENDIMSLPFVKEDVINLPRLNTTADSRGVWYEHVDDNDLRMVEEWAGKDFEMFNYEKVTETT